MEISLLKPEMEYVFLRQFQQMFVQEPEKIQSELQHLRNFRNIPGEGRISVLNGMMARPSRLSVMEEGKSPLLWILGVWTIT